MTTQTINFLGNLFLYREASKNIFKKRKIIFKEMGDIQTNINSIIDLREGESNTINIISKEAIKIPITLIKKTSGEVKVRFSNEPVYILKNTIDLR